MNFLQAAEKLAGFAKELEPIKSKFPGVYSDFVRSLTDPEPDAISKELFERNREATGTDETVSPIRNNVPPPKTTTDHIRTYIQENGGYASGVDIVDGIVDDIETSSKNRRRVIQQTLNNMLNRGDLVRDSDGDFALDDSGF